MPLSFDDAWLDRSPQDFASDLKIQGRAGDAAVRFCIPRGLALKQLQLPPTQEALPGIAQWTEVLRRACVLAYDRAREGSVVEIEVREEDFPRIAPAQAD